MLAPTKPVKSCECGSHCGGGCCCTKESIGLGNVDNTSDLNKPLSRDMDNALSGKVGLDVFTQLKNRVLALENSIPDITALENRMTNAESNIVTLQSNYANLSQAISNLTDTVNTLSGRVTNVNDSLVTVGTRVDALEAKDSNNVKLSGTSVQTIKGTLKANDPVSGATDKTLVTANWVSQTGTGAPNNLVHRSGTETINGTKALNALKFVGITANEEANTDYLLFKHSLTSTTQDYRCILQICKTNPVICQLIYLDYNITNDRIVTLTNSRQTTLTNYNSPNTSMYSIYIENNQAYIAIRTSQNQGVVCNVIANWVGSRFGVITDIGEQGSTVVIPTQHVEVIL